MSNPLFTTKYQYLVSVLISDISAVYTMKRNILTILFSFALLLGPAFNANAGAVINKPPTTLGLISGLVGYWPFDGNAMSETNAYDLSGNGNHGTLTNGPTLAIGKISQATNFDGVNDNVTIESPSALDNMSQFSISLWYYPRSQGKFDQGFVISKGNGGSDWHVSMGDENRLDFFVDYNGGTDLRRSTANGVHAFNKWHHMVVTWSGSADATTVHFYINGTEVGYGTTDNGVGSRVLDTGNAAIGNTNGSNREFDGLIDDVRVYDRVLSPAEIKRLYNIGATFKVNVPSNTGSLTQGLVGYWSFDGPDMAGNTAYDRSGNGNNGTFTADDPPLPRPALGRIGQGLEFLGINNNNHVNMGSPASLNNIEQQGGGGMTVAFWYKPTIEDEQDFLVGKDGGSGSWTVYTNCCGPGAWFAFFKDYAGATDLDVSSGLNTVLQGWQHVVVAWNGVSDGAGVHFFINGVESPASINDVGAGAKISDEAIDFKVGGGDQNQELPHTFDDVRVYNRILSPDEIKRLYKIGSTFKINTSQNTGTLKDGLVGYWSFDDQDLAGVTAYDRSGNANNGTLTNGPERTIGKIGQGLRFDGLNNRVSSPSAPSLMLSSSITVSAWVKSVNEGTGWLTIFDKHSPSVNNNYVLEVVEGTSGAAREVDFFYYSSGGVANEWQTTDNVLLPNEWTHLAATFTFGAGSSMRIYVNGVSVAGGWTTGDGTLIPASDDDGFGIGALQSGGNEFGGTIDDVRIYNRVLSPDEIKRLYNTGR